MFPLGPLTEFRFGESLGRRKFVADFSLDDFAQSDVFRE
jgi:hypothetical protein